MLRLSSDLLGAISPIGDTGEEKCFGDVSRDFRPEVSGSRPIDNKCSGLRASSRRKSRVSPLSSPSNRGSNEALNKGSEALMIVGLDVESSSSRSSPTCDEYARGQTKDIRYKGG